MNPDVIIIPTNNMANGQPDFTADEVMSDEQLKEVAAVKNGAVYNMPTGFEAWDLTGSLRRSGHVVDDRQAASRSIHHGSVRR